MVILVIDGHGHTNIRLGQLIQLHGFLKLAVHATLIINHKESFVTVSYDVHAWLMLLYITILQAF